MLLRPAALRRGISLLEVLGATAIFLMSIVAIGELMSVSTDQAVDVRHRSRATRLCQSKLNEFTAGVELVTGATSGEFEEEPEWTWQAEVTSETTAINLYRVRVTVSRETARGLVEVSMTQFVYDPQQRGHLTAGTPASAAPTDAGAAGTTTGGGMAGGAGASGGSGGSGGGAGGRPGGGGALGFGGGVPGGGGGMGGRPPGGGMGFGGGVPGGGGGRPPGGGGGFGGGVPGGGGRPPGGGGGGFGGGAGFGGGGPKR